MANCPHCNILLQTVRQSRGMYYECNECHGRAITVPQIRLRVGDRFISPVIRKMNTSTEESPCACPFCQVLMKRIHLTQPPLALDSCKSCAAIWFEAGAFEQLPEGACDSPEEAFGRALQAEAQWKMDQQARRSQFGADPPDEWWKWIPAVLGFPVKYESAEVLVRPWVTWILSALIAIISIAAFFDLEDAVENFALVPAEAFRDGGITFITSFFLHAGILHLVGNLYFFILFGGEVEEHLGHWRFLALVFLSTMVGHVFHILGNLHSLTPCIGASGGISGVLVFYALQFPKGTLAFFTWRFGWVHLPAWGAFIIWLLLQLLGVCLQKEGLSHVSSMAHLGGVTTGFLLWLWWRKLGLKNAYQDADFN